MTAINLTPALELVISICVGIATRYLVPLIIAKIGAERTKDLMRKAGIVIRAAEQMYKESGSGQAKLNYALQQLQEQGFKLSPGELRAAVEAAVYEMNNAVMEQTDAIGFNAGDDA